MDIGTQHWSKRGSGPGGGPDPRVVRSSRGSGPGGGPSPGLSRPGLVAALVEAVKALCQLRPKLQVEEVGVAAAEHPGGEHRHLLMARVVEDRENLQRHRQLQPWS